MSLCTEGWLHCSGPHHATHIFCVFNNSNKVSLMGETGFMPIKKSFGVSQIKTQERSQWLILKLVQNMTIWVSIHGMIREEISPGTLLSLKSSIRLWQREFPFLIGGRLGHSKYYLCFTLPERSKKTRFVFFVFSCLFCLRMRTSNFGKFWTRNKPFILSSLTTLLPLVVVLSITCNNNVIFRTLRQNQCMDVAVVKYGNIL